MALAIAMAVLSGCVESVPERWEHRGFDSEAECWLNHGWDGSVSDSQNRKGMFDFWCGPMTDGDGNEPSAAAVETRSSTTTIGRQTPTTAAVPQAAVAECSTLADFGAATLDEVLVWTDTVDAALTVGDFAAAQEAYDLIAWVMADWGSLASQIEDACADVIPDDIVGILVAMDEMAAGWRTVQSYCRRELAPMNFNC